MGELHLLSDYREVDPVVEMLSFLKAELAVQMELLGDEPMEPLYFTYSDRFCPCCGKQNTPPIEEPDER